jgi:hypothetical protein
MTHRFFIYGPFALFVLLALGLSVRWWAEAEAFSRRLDAMNGHEVMPGVALRFTEKRISGFPFRLDATFKNIAIEVATPHGPSHWRAEDFALHRLTYGTKRTLFEAAGRQSLDWTDEEGRPHELPFESGSMHASASEDAGGLARFDIDAIGLGSPALNAAHAQFHVRLDPHSGGADLFASADEVQLAPAYRSVFGDHIASLTLASTLLPGAPLARLRAGEVSWPDAMRAFQQANGSAHIDTLAMALRDVAVSGHGSFGIDAEMRPRGILDLGIVNFARFVARARASGVDAGGKGLASALLKRAQESGSDESGRQGVVYTCSGGIDYIGDVPIGLLGTLL